MKTILFVSATAISIATLPTLNAWAAEGQKERIAANYMKADENADGALTFAEFSSLIDLNAAAGVGRASMIKRMGKQSMAFERLDANADGLVTVDEISAMAARAKR